MVIESVITDDIIRQCKAEIVLSIAWDIVHGYMVNVKTLFIQSNVSKQTPYYREYDVEIFKSLNDYLSYLSIKNYYWGLKEDLDNSKLKTGNITMVV